jgi:5-hydroxyisourate hydrolase
MVIASGAYFKTANLPRSGAQILDEIVVRFTTPDPDSRYHIPVIMAPNSYSCWWSA